MLPFLIAVVVGLFAYNFYQGQPKTLSSVLKVEYSGYDGDGMLTYNTEDVAVAVAEYAYKKAGFSSNDAKALANGDNVIMSKIYSDNSLSTKYSQALAMIESVSYSFDKTTQLSNDQEIVFSVTTTSQHAPVKAEKKIFKVKDLKAYEIIKSEDLLKEAEIAFSGFNGYGQITQKVDSYDAIFNLTNSIKTLKNGDEVTLTVNDYYISKLKQEGKAIDEISVSLEVSGLAEVTSISNLSDLLAKNDTYAKSQKENTSYRSYTLERQKDFLKYVAGSDASTSGQVYLVTVYKITATSGSSTEVSYNYYGYSAYVRKDNSLDLDTANKLSGWATKDFENMVADLETSDYKEYKAE